MQTHPKTDARTDDRLEELRQHLHAARSRHDPVAVRSVLNAIGNIREEEQRDFEARFDCRLLH